MRKFFIITNRLKDYDYCVTNRIVSYLKNMGAECVCQNPVISYDSCVDKGYIYTDIKEIPTDTECIIVLGGDGTLIQAARDTNVLNIPLLGVNIGTLGYLTDADLNTVYDSLNCCINDEYEVDKRMMLDGRIYRNNRLLYSDVALNDIVINRCGTLRVIDFDIFVNREYLNSYSADGVIISTATGSTAYSLSAGGPIIQPNAKLLMMTPICPHSLNQRSIIFGSRDEIVVQMSDNKKLGEERVVTFDGESSFSVITGDKIVVTKSSRISNFIKTNKLSFLQRIRNKM